MGGRVQQRVVAVLVMLTSADLFPTIIWLGTMAEMTVTFMTLIFLLNVFLIHNSLAKTLTDGPT